MKGIAVCKTCAKSDLKENVHFFCPKDSLIHQEQVDFFCNQCKASEMIYKNGIYFCPECLTTANSLQCRICGSKEVTFPQEVKNGN